MIPVHATCSGSYPYSSYSAANYDDSCHYNVSSSWFAGRCGGTGRTCYARGSIIPVNGSCDSPYSTHYPTCRYGVRTGSNPPYSSGARCTGTNPICHGCCHTPTCNSGFTGPVVATTPPCDRKKFDTPHAGIQRCDTHSAHRDTFHSACHNNNELCYKFKTCAAINPLYPDEWDASKSRDYVFNPDSLGNGGPNGFRCGKYSLASQAWWQTISGNVYAADSVYSINTAYHSTCEAPNCSPYIIRPIGNCSATPSFTAGIAMSGQAGSTNFKPYSSLNNRSPTQKSVAAYPAFSAGSTNNKEDFAYFQSLINYSQLTACNHSSPVIIDGYTVCKTNTTSNSNLNLKDNFTGKMIVFVEGDLTINHDIRLTPGNYLAFIVRDNLIIDGNLGDDITGDTCASGNGHVQGVYIANKIEIPSSRNELDDVFNRGAFCDKKLILEGSFISWSSITSSRTFKGCGLDAGIVYPDYNATNPTETIIYRPDFVTNTPDWMKQPKMMRLEAI